MWYYRHIYIYIFIYLLVSAHTFSVDISLACRRPVGQCGFIVSGKRLSLSESLTVHSTTH